MDAITKPTTTKSKSSQAAARCLFHVTTTMMPQLLARISVAEANDPSMIQWGSAFGRLARRDLARYYSFLRSELMRIHLSAADAARLCEALRPHLPKMAQKAVYKSWNEGDKVWREIPDMRLPGLPDNLTEGQALALLDAVERLYLRHNKATEAAMREVGLIR